MRTRVSRLRGALAVCGVVTALLWLPHAARAQAPAQLPHYDLDMRLDVAGKNIQVRENVVWTNTGKTPTNVLVFTVSSRYAVPDADIGLLAKTLEILRLAPSDAMTFKPPFEVDHIQQAGLALNHRWLPDNQTALEITLPNPVLPGQSVPVTLDFHITLPQKQGRWGQWRGVTFLAQWLPVLAVYEDCKWCPTPFIPWHQPFYNEAGQYTARLTLPCDQKVACSAAVGNEVVLANGWKQITFIPTCVRDFSLVTSARFREYESQVGAMRLRCLAFPEHEFYARKMLQWASECIPAYSNWFGPLPYPQLTIAESYFGWNGNECGGMVMIDERVFDLPHLATGYVEQLVVHEICHQWWYNVIGTNGYCETFMDEAMATHFSNRYVDKTTGKNNNLLVYPKGLGWLPNIRRDDYRAFTLLGVVKRGEATPVIQEMPKFGHLVNLLAMCYDRGGKVVGMIEERVGEENMHDFTRHLYRKYQFRILRVKEFQRELEEYTGRPWEEFFHDWLYTTKLTDWSLDKVQLEPLANGKGHRAANFLNALRRDQPFKAVINISQKLDINEPTVLGIRLPKSGAILGDPEGDDDTERYQIRLPITGVPGVIQIDQPPARIETRPDNTVTIEVTLPSRPTQIMIDPDNVLLDADPSNNRWKSHTRVRVTPLYTQLDDTDMTNAADRHNVTVGPWFYTGSSFNDPWFQRSTIMGARAGVYRSQEFFGGGYVGYRTDDRSLVAGVDGLWDHCLFPHLQIGFNAERALGTVEGGGPEASRGVLFGRYVFMYADSVLLPPFHYLEGFTSVQDHPLESPRYVEPNTDPFNQQTSLGIHHHLYYLTPYWNPEGGIASDITYELGIPVFGEHRVFNKVFGQFSTVKNLPEWLDWTRDVSCLSWLMDSRFAVRAFGGAAFPNDGLLYTLGGGSLFRGFDVREREGNMMWVGSVEWRLPLLKEVEYHFLDHVGCVRNVYVAPFYDVGDIYVNNHSVGGVANAVGLGLRVDVGWFGIIERTMLRFDVAQTVGGSTMPTQFWFGLQHPF